MTRNAKAPKPLANRNIFDAVRFGARKLSCLWLRRYLDTSLRTRFYSSIHIIIVYDRYSEEE
jgi:hypothetical protein